MVCHKVSLWLAILVLLLPHLGRAEEPISKNQSTTGLENIICVETGLRQIDDLPARIRAHAEWLRKRGWMFPEIQGKADFSGADLCGKNLRGVDLSLANMKGAELSGADLRSAILNQVELESAVLRKADMRGAHLDYANLKSANLHAANLEGVRLRRAILKFANLSYAILKSAQMDNADLYRADLRNADFSMARLPGADLTSSKLESAKLEKANLFLAKLERANLDKAVMREANLQLANLQNAYFKDVDLSNADLRRAILNGAILDKTDLREAKIYQAKLRNVLYQPATAPANGYLAKLPGLGSIRFCPGEHSGLVQLRNALKKDDLRELERLATYLIESSRTRHALGLSDAVRREKWFQLLCLSSLEENRPAAMEGVLRLVFFEWITGYGLHYARPIQILLFLIFAFTFVYLPSIFLTPRNVERAGGIYRVLPEGRIECHRDGMRLAEVTVIERLNSQGFAALGLAFYFSVVSAFHFGWRDLHVGTWIARLQPREYALRANGWVRVVSGCQSLISIYLIAMWALTYFGRPFG